jgi:hypothetical protein
MNIETKKEALWAVYFCLCGFPVNRLEPEYFWSDYSYWGFCLLLDKLYYVRIGDIPELEDLKPNRFDLGGYWFPIDFEGNKSAKK